MLYGFVFPLDEVVVGKKPLAALVGWRYVLVMAGGMITNTILLDRYNDVLRRLAATIYLRDWTSFKRQSAQAVALSFVYSFIQIGSARLYILIASLWRHELTRAVQAKYMRSQAYYRLQQQDQQQQQQEEEEDGGERRAIRDADQRIAEDAKAVTTVLAGMVYRTMTYSTNLIGSVLRLAWLIHPKYVVICVGYLMVCERVREKAVPAMRLGLLTGEISRTTGEYHSAQLRLQENCEPIVAMRGTQAEKRRIMGTYAKMEKKQIEYFAESEKDTFWYSGVITVMTTPTMQSLLVEAPFISRAGPAVHRSSQEGLEANAQILGEMAFVTTSMTRLMTYLRAMLMLRRIMLTAAGTATRLVELLDASDMAPSTASTAGSDLSSQCDDSDSIQLERLTVQPPGGGAAVLIRDLDLSLTPGQNLLVVGENGVGKTSLFRTLSGLWPSPAAGRMRLPRYSPTGRGGDERMALCFVPQSPYCPLGSLQDAITYLLRTI
jgi:ABC-type uncharacterized transport system fused permease/ATPase subunit